jgi:predicted nucleic acid-binding Zn ribbon protein
MRKWTVLLALGLFAASAYGIGLGAGGFGGIALPMGDMAAEDDETTEDWDGGNLGMSPKFGGKVLIGVMPALDIEVAFAYHLNHKQKDWEAVEGVDEPKTTIIPITFGANYKLMFDAMGVYFGGGGGFYMEKMKESGEIFGIPFEAEASINKPGIYFGGGFMYSFGKLALDVNPRFNYVMNSGDVDIDLTIGGETETVTVNKAYKDMFVDVLFGVDYFFM